MKDLIFLKSYLVKYKNSILLGFFFILISNLCSTYVPRIIGNTIDKIKLGEDAGIFSSSDIYPDIAFLLGLTALSGLFMFYSRRTIILASRKIEFELRNDFIDKLSKKSMSFFRQHRTGEIMSHVTNDISAAREFLGPAFMYGANTITVSVFALYFMLDIDPIVTMASLIPLPLISILVYYFGKKIHKLFENVQEKFSELSSFTQESFSGIQVIKAFGRIENEGEYFRTHSLTYYDNNLKLIRIQTVSMPLMLILIGVSEIIVLGVGGYKVLEGIITLGQLTQFFIYLNMLIWPVIAMGWIINVLQRAAASTKRLKRLMDDIDAENSETPKRPFSLAKEISFSNVSLKFNDQIALLDINFKIPINTSIGIVGHIGSGKSGIANLLLGLTKPSSGIIKFDDFDINLISMKHLRSSIAYVPQDTFLFSLSIKDNICFGAHEKSFAEMKEICDLVLLTDEIEMFPDKYDTILGERGITLSGGQKQRTAIAMALIKNPDILILDDALSAVDIRTEIKILNNIKKLFPKLTLIIISHRISTVSQSDNILVLENGKIIEQGRHNELLQLKGKYENFSRIQNLEEKIKQL